MKAPKHTTSDSSLEPFGYGTEKEDKSKQAFLRDTVSTLPKVSIYPHLLPEIFLLQTADKILEGFPTVSHQAGMDLFMGLQDWGLGLWERSSAKYLKAVKEPVSKDRTYPGLKTHGKHS